MPAAQSPPSAPSAENLFCITCGYNQRGITSAHCPECGQDFSKLPPSPTLLPWIHRRRLGLFRAYWRTALMVFFRPKFFHDQIDNPISLKDARRFWLLSIVHALLPPLFLLLYMAIHISPANLVALMHFISQTIFVPVPVFYFFLFGFILFLIAATGMPGYFCHPHSLGIGQQNRAIALSYFASAPIALMPLIFALAVAAEFLLRLKDIAMTLRALAAAVAVFMLGAWYIRTAGLVLAVSQRRHRNLTVLLLTVCWLFLLVLFLMVVPLAL